MFAGLTPTLTPTSLVFAQFRRASLSPKTIVYLRIPRFSEALRNCLLYLGVKWSQVQILSARPKFLQFRAFFDGIPRLRLVAFRLQYANQRAHPTWLGWWWRARCWVLFRKRQTGQR